MDKSKGGFQSKTMFRWGRPFIGFVIYNDLLKHFKANNHEPISNGNKVRWVYLKQILTTSMWKLKVMINPKQIIDFINQYIDRDKLFDKALSKR